jgi:hypothetical protein
MEEFEVRDALENMFSTRAEMGTSLVYRLSE